MPTDNIFPACQEILGHKIWQKTIIEAIGSSDPDTIYRHIDHIADNSPEIQSYIPDLAKIEYALIKAAKFKYKYTDPPNQLTLNPSLEMQETNFQGLIELIGGQNNVVPIHVSPPVIVLIWQDLATETPHLKTASKSLLLGLKVVIENLDPKQLATEHKVSVGTVDSAIELCIQQGLILAPSSKIQRTCPAFAKKEVKDTFLQAEVFTLQWHITQACDLHCKHCYDRSNRKSMELKKSLALMDQMRDFCRSRYVGGQISFSGGNPFLHPNFFNLYQAANDRNFGIAILGNVVSQSELERCIAIQKPVFYQVSLEGLRDHNDAIRGQGYYDRVMKFLEMLKNMDIYSMVMLTLTRDNIDQVLPLAEALREKADLFTFNRLAMVGEGADLACASTTGYRDFLSTYSKEAASNPVMAFKDNLFNIINHEKEDNLFGGCAGHGCGAAFNFISVLPDGQVHACRKYPSPIGDLNNSTLEEIYESETAETYRQGSSACAQCQIRPVCGGCPAVVHGLGLDPFTDLDPYCFVDRDLERPPP